MSQKAPGLQPGDEGPTWLVNTHALGENENRRKTVKYRRSPTPAQQRCLCQQLEECRWLYNHRLAERRAAWEQRQASVRRYDQHATLPALKAERPSVAVGQSPVVQHVAVRID